MTRSELRLELLRIVHHTHQSHTLTLEIVDHYEKAFEGLVTEESAASPPEAKPRPPKTPR
jgi:hypothetical protein